MCVYNLRCVSFPSYATRSTTGIGRRWARSPARVSCGLATRCSGTVAKVGLSRLHGSERAGPELVLLVLTRLSALGAVLNVRCERSRMHVLI